MHSRSLVTTYVSRTQILTSLTRANQGLVKELGYTEKGPAKLNALKKFLTGRSNRCHVDQRYTDFFG